MISSHLHGILCLCMGFYPPAPRQVLALGPPWGMQWGWGSQVPCVPWEAAAILQPREPADPARVFGKEVADWECWSSQLGWCSPEDLTGSGGWVQGAPWAQLCGRDLSSDCSTWAMLHQAPPAQVAGLCSTLTEQPPMVAACYVTPGCMLCLASSTPEWLRVHLCTLVCFKPSDSFWVQQSLPLPALVGKYSSPGVGAQGL